LNSTISDSPEAQLGKLLAYQSPGSYDSQPAVQLLHLETKTIHTSSVLWLCLMKAWIFKSLVLSFELQAFWQLQIAENG